ncbi:MAG: M20/M25/M40 family metallo-hydrolase [Meiothermus sp.]|nr:M20/M25/M40 family metallo-hydrolase [Meiothermus sp.]
MSPAQTQALAIRLTQFKSVTNTEGESGFGPFLREVLLENPYFQARPEQVWLEPTLDDPFERSNVFALVKGRTSKTLILTGHYDVVSTANYGILEALATEPEALRAALIAELGVKRRNAAEEKALSDLESGLFLPGRGLLDMKSGLAAGMAVLDRWAQEPEHDLNLLFIAVPDEEVASYGMRSAVRQLPAVCGRWGLEPVCAVNLDVHADPGDGSEGRAIFLGSVGKMLPFVLFVGRPTHVGAVFDGVNPSLLMAEFVRRLEANPSFGDPPGQAEYPAPPAVLYARETRTHYDVTTPHTAFCAVNLLTHSRGPQEVLQSVRQLAGESLNAALELLRARAAEHSRRGGVPVTLSSGDCRVLDFAELKALAQAKDPAEVGAILEQTLPGGDGVERSQAIAQALVRLAGLEGTAAVVGFAPPFYPRAELDPLANAAFLKILRDAAEEVGTETGEGVRLAAYFPGISDMTFLNPADAGAEAAVAAQTPTARPVGPLEQLGCPVVNIGPWGREYHQKLERVQVRYAFETVPELLWRVARAVERDSLPSVEPPA